MMKTLERLQRAVVGWSLTAGTLFLFATGACGQVSQCVKGKINSQECWVGLQVSGSSVIVTPSAVAVYSDTKLSWKRIDTANPAGKADFAVDFADCTPFHEVRHFDQSTPAPIADELPTAEFEVCKYKVTIDNAISDSQVIVIGGPKHHTGSWKRRLGTW